MKQQNVSDPFPLIKGSFFSVISGFVMLHCKSSAGDQIFEVLLDSRKCSVYLLHVCYFSKLSKEYDPADKTLEEMSKYLPNSLAANYCSCKFVLTRFKHFDQLSRLMRKPTKWLCTQRRLRSAWASSQSDQSFRCALNRYLRTQALFMRTAKTLIRLGTVILLVLSWGGSIYYCPDTCSARIISMSVIIEPRHEKTCLWDFQPGKTQTSLLRYRDKLESWMFLDSKYRYYTI